MDLMKIDVKMLALLALLFFISQKGGDPPSPAPDVVLAAKQAGVAYLSGLADELEAYEAPETEQGAYEGIDELFNRVGKSAFNALNQRMDDMEYTPEELNRFNKNVAKGLRRALK